jgi:4'-phosphopantetheinyl transferase
MTLYPVVLPLSEADPALSGKERLARLSRIAREALRLSAETSGVTVGELAKDEDDVPLPSNGIHWSVSHKPSCVAAVVSNEPIGIDVEEIGPRDEAIYALVGSDEEWELGGGRSWDTFFRYWTAKEAVLKAVGVGIGGLKKCRVASLPDEDRVVLEYRDHTYVVEQLRHRSLIVSVLKNGHDVQWVIADRLRAQEAL